MWLSSVKWLATMLLANLAVISAIPIPPPGESSRQPVLDGVPAFNIESKPLAAPAYLDIVNNLQNEIERLGFGRSNVQLDYGAIYRVNEMKDFVRTQMLTDPGKRQYIQLFDDGQGHRVLAMPIVGDIWGAWRDVLGNFNGKGGSHRLMIFGVRARDPTELALARGPARTVELYGIAGATRVKGLPDVVATHTDVSTMKNLQEMLHF